MTFRIAVVQPIANPIEEDEKNVADAVQCGAGGVHRRNPAENLPGVPVG